MPEQIDTIDTPIALEAKDLLPETWEALAEADSFGPAALERRHDRVVGRIFGVVLEDAEQAVLDDVVIEYAGKKLALELLVPAIDYWSKQRISQTAGERQSETYADRARDLRELRKQWTADLAALWLDVVDLIPIRPGRAVDVPVVAQAGETIPHITPDPGALEPLAGEPEDTTRLT